MPRTESLPIYQYRTRIIETIAQRPTTIIVGEPGCGKSTVLPQFLLPMYQDRGRIAVTQPRRLAAQSIAAYTASRLGSALGRLVGYRVRFDQQVTPETKLLFLTEGMLLRDFQEDPHLLQYAVVVLDEVHERSLDMDMCLGLTHHLLERRSDLRVVLMSATMETRKLARFFQAPVIEIHGKTYPVSIQYRPINPQADNGVSAMVEEIRTLCRSPQRESSAEEGILAFLPGEGEIYDTRRRLMEERLQNGRLMEERLQNVCILPLHATLTPTEQGRVFRPVPRGHRKIVLATNIAETSVTVPGVSVVIDAGLIREPRYDAVRGVTALEVVEHSRAGCDQRAGRAGRLRPGVCIRLFRATSYERRPRMTMPEIRRTSLEHLVLVLRSLGVDNVHAFGFLDPPPADALYDVLETLRCVGAMDEHGGLTILGQRILSLPLGPRLSAVLFAAAEEGCLEEALTICAALSGKPLFHRPRAEVERARDRQRVFHTDGSDCLTLHTAYRLWQENGEDSQWCEEHFIRADVLREAKLVRAQLEALLRQLRVPFCQTAPASRLAIDKALIAGFGDQLWQRVSGRRYERTRGEWCLLGPRSPAWESPPPWMVCVAVLRVENRPYTVGVHPIDPQLVSEHLMHHTAHRRLGPLHYDVETDAVLATTLIKTADGQVQRLTAPVNGAEAIAYLAAALADRRLATATTAENHVLLKELEDLRLRIGERQVPFISRGALEAFYRERLADHARLREVPADALRLTKEALARWLPKPLRELRELRSRNYPDSILVKDTRVPVRYEWGVPHVLLDAHAVATLPYDCLILPGGDLIHATMVIRSPGGTEESRCMSTSLKDLKNVLKERRQTQESQAVLQSRCDLLRDRLRSIRTRLLLPKNVQEELRSCLEEVEAIVYAWMPDLSKAEHGLRVLEERLNQLEKK